MLLLCDVDGALQGIVTAGTSHSIHLVSRRRYRVALLWSSLLSLRSAFQSAPVCVSGGSSRLQ